MKKVCDVCGQELGFRKFKYQEGCICKDCYQKASRNYTDTITGKTRKEVMDLCQKQDSGEEDWGNFIRTGKIGNYILFDDKHHSFCITHNRMNEKERQKAEIIPYADLKRAALYCEPKFSREELRDLKDSRKDTVIKALEIRVWTDSQPGMKKIVMLSSPVRAKSFAFRRIFDFAEKILDKLDTINEKDEKENEREAE